MEFEDIRDPAVRQLLMDRLAKQKALKEAQDVQSNVRGIDLAGQALHGLSNANQESVVYANRLQDMGKAPQISRPERTEYDPGTGAQDAARGVASAETGLANVGKDYALNRSITDQDEQNSPASSSSQSARDALLKVYPKAAEMANFPNMTAAQIQKIMGPLAAARQGELNRYEKRAGRQAAADKANAPKPERNLTESQGKALMYGKRIEQAMGEMSDISSTGFDRTDLASGLGSSLMPNITRTDEGVRNDQAEANFLNAVLRRESGSAINANEFDKGEKQYFPRVGDGAGTIAQKARNRQKVLESFKVESASGWDKVPGGVGGQSSSTAVSTEDTQAMEWAQANPDDPRAQAILSHAGGR